MSESSVVIGINFGAMYTSIGYLNKEGRADCLANEEGDRQIASVLAFHGTEEVVGSQAKSDIARHPKSTVANFRSNLGVSFNDALHLSGSSAPLVDQAGSPAYEVTKVDKTEVLAVKEVSAKYLRHIRQSAEDFLGTAITGAVMGVPSYFSEQQRAELVAAAEEAGIQVIQLIHESTAAALAYNSDKRDTRDKVIVVCDMGGHSFDVTVLTVRSGIYSVLATAHDTKLGGSSFDDLLIDFFAAEFKKKAKVDIAGNNKALAKLRGAVEATKKMLSSQNSAPCFVESLAEGLDFHTTINRLRFEMMSNKIYARIEEVISEVLTKADLDASEIDEVILAGGSTRMPKFASRLRNTFTSESTVILSDIESDEVVARGCAIQGNLVAGFDKEDITASVHPVVTLAPSTHKPIGVVNAQGEFVTLIPRGTALPARRVFSFQSADSQQTHAYFALHEGNHSIEKIEVPVPPIEVEEGEEPIEEEPEIITKVVITPAQLLVEACLPLDHAKAAKASSVEVQVTVDVDRKLNLVLREANSSNIVKAEVAASA